MATKAELEQQLAEAQKIIDQLAQQAAEKNVVVTARIPLALREEMKKAAARSSTNLQGFMLQAFKDRLERLKDE